MALRDTKYAIRDPVIPLATVALPPSIRKVEPIDRPHVEDEIKGPVHKLRSKG